MSVIPESRLLAKLWALKRGEIDTHYGICASIADALGLSRGSRVTFIRHDLMPRFVDWPEFSGDPEYPVPHPQHPGNVGYAQSAYLILPLWCGEYGSARIRLLNFMIRTLEQRIKDAV